MTPRTIDLTGLQRLIEEGVQLVEVLPEQEYRWGHLPAATSLPLKTLTSERASVLGRDRPVAVYCWDAL